MLFFSPVFLGQFTKLKGKFFCRSRGVTVTVDQQFDEAFVTGKA